MFTKNIKSRSQWPRGLRRRNEAARLLGIAASNYTDGVDVCLLRVLNVQV